MASADENYRDSDGAPSDWIEITNSGDSEESLEGCYLTNNNDDPTRWTFPQTKIPAGNSIVIFASGKDRKDTNELHTSFTLDRGGDYLGLIGPDGVTVLSEVAPNYPQQYENISYGIGMANGAKSLSLVKFGSNVKYFIADTDVLANDWKKAPSLFNDSSWTEALSPLGFESSGGILEDSIATNIKDEMRGTNASGLFRYPFTFDSNSKQVTSLELKVIIDDGFVAYLNGVEVGSFGKPSPFLWNSSSTKSRSDNIVKSTPIIIDLTSHRSALIDGNNVLAIQGMNQSRSSSDFIIDAELSAQFRDTSAGIQYGYFINPTPGKPNDSVLNGPPQEITFSKQSCMFTQSFELRLSTKTPGAIIRYTTCLLYTSPSPRD